MMTPAEIARELARDLVHESEGQRTGLSIDFLEADLRDAPARHRSMRAVFDHSWRLLLSREQEILAGLSVFRGGFTQQAAQQVTGASLRELRTLISKSLLHRESTGRYVIHELLRQYAEERLGRLSDVGETVRNRHCAYFGAALQEWTGDLKSARQQAAMAAMDAEIENARVAWNWAVAQGHVELLDQGMESLGLFYLWRQRHQEGEFAFQKAAERLTAMIEQSPGKGQPAASQWTRRVLIKILAWQSAFRLERTESTPQPLEQGLALLEGPELADCDTRLERAFILLRMGECGDRP